MLYAKILETKEDEKGEMWVKYSLFKNIESPTEIAVASQRLITFIFLFEKID